MRSSAVLGFLASCSEPTQIADPTSPAPGNATGDDCGRCVEEVISADELPEDLELSEFVARGGTRTGDVTWWSGEVEATTVSATVLIHDDEFIHQTATTSTGELCFEGWLAHVAVDVVLSGDHPWDASWTSLRDVGTMTDLAQHGQLASEVWDVSMPVPDSLVPPVEQVDVLIYWPDSGELSGRIHLIGYDSVVLPVLEITPGA